jgi:hypothetical protein
MPAPIRSLIAHFPEELGVSGPEQPASAGEPEPKGPDDPYMRRPAEPRENGGGVEW